VKSIEGDVEGDRIPDPDSHGHRFVGTARPDVDIEALVGKRRPLFFVGHQVGRFDPDDPGNLLDPNLRSCQPRVAEVPDLVEPDHAAGIDVADDTAHFVHVGGDHQRQPRALSLLAGIDIPVHPDLELVRERPQMLAETADHGLFVSGRGVQHRVFPYEFREMLFHGSSFRAPMPRYVCRT
jgi:hypothetical protein